MTETTGTTEKKGLSKGCLIGLIVAAVLLVMVIVAVIVIYIYREDLSKFAGTAVITQIRQQVAQDPPPGLDTAAFNTVCTEFTTRLEADSVDAEAYAAFLSKVRTIPMDKVVDSAEAVIFLDAVFEYYPELEDLYQPAGPPDTSEVIDTVASEI